MKKTYVLLALALIGLMAYTTNIKAQTITSADLPVIGEKIQNNFDTLPSSASKLSPGNAGTGQTWNYGFVPASYDQVDSFVTPSNTPYAASFPNATIADSTFGTIGYTYLNTSGSAFTAVGSEQNIQGYLVAAVLTPPFTQLNLPAQYGDTLRGSSRAFVPAKSITFTGIDSVKGSITIFYHDSIDASGNITTPYSTYAALRQKHYETDIDSFFVHSTVAQAWVFYQATVTYQNEYIWYTNGIGYSAATLQMDSAFTTPTAFEWYNGIPNGINEVSRSHNTLAFPNPCSNQITFRYSTPGASYISAFDITGRELGTTAVKNGKATVNTSSFANGIYLYRVLDKSGNVLDNGKFSVQQ